MGYNRMHAVMTDRKIYNSWSCDDQNQVK